MSKLMRSCEKEEERIEDDEFVLPVHMRNKTYLFVVVFFVQLQFFFLIFNYFLRFPLHICKYRIVSCSSFFSIITSVLYWLVLANEHLLFYYNLIDKHTHTHTYAETKCIMDDVDVVIFIDITLNSMLC